MYQVGGLCLKYTIFGVVLMTLHYFASILSSLNLKINDLYSIHLINFFLSFICSLILLLILPKMKNKIGFVFIGLSTIKFFVIIVFVALSIMNKIEVENIALQFICVTLLYLFFDVKWIITQISSSKT
tara:strand:- start:131 stop:514 length:384 start_codon:yes stop_codon:yes gene_type:complete